MKHKTQKKEGRKTQWCFTLKQSAFCLSLIMLIITSVFCICAEMAKLHTDRVWSLLQADIEEEREKNYYDEGHLSNNEARLLASKELALVGAWILLVWLIIGCANLTSVLFLIYGIITDNSPYMILWIVTSAFTYFGAMVTLVILYFKPHYDFYIGDNTIKISSVVFIIFIPIWSTITIHYKKLKKLTSKAAATKIKGNGGYIHTLNTIEDVQKKLLV